MGQPVIHWEIGSPNAQRLHNFYSALFDWQIDANNPMNYGVVRTGGEGGIDGGIFQFDGKPGYVSFYVQVDDLAAYLAKAEALGGKTAMPPTPVPGVGTIAWFLDPDNKPIGLLQPSSEQDRAT